MTQTADMLLHPREFAGVSAVAKRFKSTVEEAMQTVAQIELAKMLSGEKPRGSSKDILSTYQRAHDNWGILLSLKQRRAIAKEFNQKKRAAKQ